MRRTAATAAALVLAACTQKDARLCGTIDGTVAHGEAALSVDDSEVWLVPENEPARAYLDSNHRSYLALRSAHAFEVCVEGEPGLGFNGRRRFVYHSLTLGR